MNYKSLYYCLKSCKPSNILIERFEERYDRRIGVRFFINYLDSEEEQVFTLLHEVVHDLPQFKGKSLRKSRDEKIESEIEKISKDIFINCPLIKNYILKQLRKAKELPDNIFFSQPTH